MVEESNVAAVVVEQDVLDDTLADLEGTALSLLDQRRSVASGDLEDRGEWRTD